VAEWFKAAVLKTTIGYSGHPRTYRLIRFGRVLERRMPQTALHLGADPRHKTIADFLAAIERRRNLAQPPREGGEVSGQLCELPHIGAPKNMGALFRQTQRDAEGMQMRLGIGIAVVVVAIGLIWSIAAMSQWVPVVSAG
jgi:hypothetical protein